MPTNAASEPNSNTSTSGQSETSNRRCGLRTSTYACRRAIARIRSHDFGARAREHRRAVVRGVDASWVVALLGAGRLVPLGEMEEDAGEVAAAVRRRRRSSGVPSATMLPCDKKTTRSHTCSTSLMSWLVISSAVPSRSQRSSRPAPHALGDVGVERRGRLVEHEQARAGAAWRGRCR